jgi:hypothetical protein
MTKIYKCFIASPGDTEKERKICEKVFAEINCTLGSKFNFRIEPIKYENDVYPNSGPDVQAVINSQINTNYDIFIGIMWKRFGTPTRTANSGTEE